MYKNDLKNLIPKKKIDIGGLFKNNYAHLDFESKGSILDDTSSDIMSPICNKNTASLQSYSFITDEEPVTYDQQQ